MAKLATNKITVFPSSRLGNDTNDIIKSRVLTQDNVCKFIRNFTGESIDGTFIVNDEGSILLTDYIEFYIHGYYFKALISDIISATSSTAFASAWIEVCQPSGSQLPTEYIYDDSDSGGSYNGINFCATSQVPSSGSHGGTIYSCRLYQYTSGNSYVISDSNYKHARLSVIDGGLS